MCVRMHRARKILAGQTFDFLQILLVGLLFNRCKTQKLKHIQDSSNTQDKGAGEGMRAPFLYCSVVIVGRQRAGAVERRVLQIYPQLAAVAALCVLMVCGLVVMVV